MMKNNFLEIKTTKDGSHTIYTDKYSADYHSKHGSIMESRHVFIKNGLEYFYDHIRVDERPVRVFEVGFGTGLNAYLTYLFAEKHRLKMCYNAVETDPIPQNIVPLLNFAKIIDYNSENKLLQLHSTTWGIGEQIGPYFHLRKHLHSFQSFNPFDVYHIIYYDAFGPRVQPEMWDLEMCQKMYHILEENGIVVTFCAQGAFRRNLAEVGFFVETLTGPPGKREMTRAVKK